MIEGAIARKELATTRGTLFTITARYVNLALENRAIVAAMLVGAPIILLVAKPDSRDRLTLLCIRHNSLSSHNLLGPSRNHGFAAVNDSLWLGFWLLLGHGIM